MSSLMCGLLVQGYKPTLLSLRCFSDVLNSVACRTQLTFEYTITSPDQEAFADAIFVFPLECTQSVLEIGLVVNDILYDLDTGLQTTSAPGLYGALDRFNCEFDLEGSHSITDVFLAQFPSLPSPSTIVVNLTYTSQTFANIARTSNGHFAWSFELPRRIFASALSLSCSLNIFSKAPISSFEATYPAMFENMDGQLVVQIDAELSTPSDGSSVSDISSDELTDLAVTWQVDHEPDNSIAFFADPDPDTGLLRSCFVLPQVISWTDIPCSSVQQVVLAIDSTTSLSIDSMKVIVDELRAGLPPSFAFSVLATDNQQLLAGDQHILLPAQRDDESTLDSCIRFCTEQYKSVPTTVVFVTSKAQPLPTAACPTSIRLFPIALFNADLDYESVLLSCRKSAVWSQGKCFGARVPSLSLVKSILKHLRGPSLTKVTARITHGPIVTESESNQTGIELPFQIQTNVSSCAAFPVEHGAIAVLGRVDIPDFEVPHFDLPPEAYNDPGDILVQGVIQLSAQPWGHPDEVRITYPFSFRKSEVVGFYHDGPHTLLKVANFAACVRPASPDDVNDAFQFVLPGMRCAMVYSQDAQPVSIAVLPLH
eukprot:GILJ01006394.1.p1 GENE.GILJ01006394.1~~GILJ01006394.1.p1  ORF type:complete len:596 (-),score=71.77 GILJ01006394.1:100-1887(-)